jgi:hypothetical protein
VPISPDGTHAWVLHGQRRSRTAHVLFSFSLVLFVSLSSSPHVKQHAPTPDSRVRPVAEQHVSRVQHAHPPLLRCPAQASSSMQMLGAGATHRASRSCCRTAAGGLLGCEVWTEFSYHYNHLLAFLGCLPQAVSTFPCPKASGFQQRRAAKLAPATWLSAACLLLHGARTKRARPS